MRRRNEEINTGFLSEPYGYTGNITRPPGKILIEVRNLSKTYDLGIVKKTKKDALKDVSFAIRENEHTAILGANGAGKTTLVEIVAGLNRQTSGEIRYDLKSANHKNQIGIQFQGASYPTSLSVADVIKFVMKLYGIRKKDVDLTELALIFGIDRIYKKRAYSLSGGEAQRINTLLALIHNPQVLFLDELSTGLDIKIRTKIKQFIKNYAFKRGMTIVIVSHDIEEIDYIAEHIVFLKNGEKIVDRPKRAIIEEYGSLVNFFEFYIK